MSDIRAVLYDFDGTLADTTELIFQTYRYTMQKHLGWIPSEEEWLEGFGRPLVAQIARVARSQEEAEAMRVTYNAYQDEHHDAMVVPFPGTVETVAALEARGIKLGIVTSKLRYGTVRGTDLCGITDHFPVIVTPEDVTRPKPHAEPALIAAERLGVRPEDALFVGDSPHDMECGRAAGMRTAAALWGAFPRATLEAAHPDFLLEAPADVLSLVEELSGVGDR